MMRGLVRCLLASLFLLAMTTAFSAAATSTMTADPSSYDTKPWRITAGAFFPTNGNLCGVSTDIGFSVAAEYDVCTTNIGGSWVGSIRYSQYDLANGATVELINPMAEYRMPLTPDGRLYVGAGAGLVFAKNNRGGTPTDFAYSVAAGLAPTPNLFLEVRFLGGTQPGENGVILGGGIRF